MGCLTWYASGGLFILWSVFIIRKVSFWMRKYRFLELPEVQQNSRFPAFTRNDFHNWNRYEMMLGGIFLLPVRICLFLSGLITGWFLLRLLIWWYKITDFSAAQPDPFIRLSRWVICLTNRVALFCCGYHNIPVVKKQFREGAYPNLQCHKNHPVTLTISNHVSYIDIVYFIARQNPPCFIAKAEATKIPFVGTFAKVLQCIFVQREVKEARFDVLNSLLDRVEKIKAGLGYSPMIIFPEGTTTNGRSLMDFKKGPFVVNTPLKIIGLKYEGNFSPAFNMIDGMDSVFMLFSQFNNRLMVMEIEGVVGPKRPMEWEEFAGEVRELMAQEFGLQKLFGTFEDKNEMEDLYLKPASQCAK